MDLGTSVKFSFKASGVNKVFILFGLNLFNSASHIFIHSVSARSFDYAQDDGRLGFGVFS